MKSFRGKLIIAFVLLVLVLGAAGVVTYKFYEIIFAKTVVGEIVGVERVNTNETIITGGANVPASQIFSFAIAIRDKTGEIHTSSSEDRQWAVATRGKCVEATFYPYPPWDLKKARTFHGARLVRMFDCPTSK